MVCLVLFPNRNGMKFWLYVSGQLCAIAKIDDEFDCPRTISLENRSNNGFISHRYFSFKGFQFFISRGTFPGSNWSFCIAGMQRDARKILKITVLCESKRICLVLFSNRNGMKFWLYVSGQLWAITKIDDEFDCPRFWRLSLVFPRTSTLSFSSHKCLRYPDNLFLFLT